MKSTNYMLNKYIYDKFELHLHLEDVNPKPAIQQHPYSLILLAISQLEAIPSRSDSVISSGPMAATAHPVLGADAV